MDLTAKLQLKPDEAVRVVGAQGLDLSRVGVKIAPDGVALIAFVRTASVLAPLLADIVGAAKADRLTWVAYPKAGGLGTNLNRDSLAAILREEGIQPVRQVAIDETWSALRFRPGRPGSAATRS